VLHLIDEAQRQIQVAALAALAMEAEEVADGKGVRPQVSAGRASSGQAGRLRELVHQVPSESFACRGLNGHPLESPLRFAKPVRIRNGSA
jgi:hypothetical protein